MAYQRDTSVEDSSSTCSKQHLKLLWVQAGMMRDGWKKFQKSDAADRDVARHICFTHDFMYSVLDTSHLPGGRTIWINDLKGVSPYVCLLQRDPSAFICTVCAAVMTGTEGASV